MDENRDSRNEDIRMEERKNNVVYMWGYLPGASPEKAPILSPVSLSLHDGDLWKDVCGGGCGFALAISGSGRLMTWGSTDDEGQIYLTSGGHGEIPETFSLPTEAAVINAAAGWAHCVSVTEKGQVYTWGWKECVPSGKVSSGMATGGSLQKDSTGKQTAQQITEQVSNPGNKKAGEEIVKRRKTSSRDEPESSTSGDENFTASPTLVSLAPGVRITTVAAGGRHTLVLSGHKKFEAIGRFLMLRKDTCCIIIFTEVSDVGQVWGWGYGGEGQLGLGSRIKMVSTPHLISCFDPAKDRPFAAHQGSMSASAQVSKGAGSYVKGIACGGRHSALITDTGALLTFGWGLYGQD